MTEKELLEKIKEETGCTDDEAEFLLYKAIQSGVVKRRLNWSYYFRRLHYFILGGLLIALGYYGYRYATH